MSETAHQPASTTERVNAPFRASPAEQTGEEIAYAPLETDQPQLTSQQIMQLQRVAGNRAVTQMLARRADAAAPKDRGTPSVQRKPNQTGLSDELKDGVERLSGLSMDDVNVHYNSPKPAEYQAHAYAQGTAIHVAPGQEKYVPHEAWHVVQQKQGRVKADVQLASGVGLNEDSALEREADSMGQQALQTGKALIQAEREPLQSVPVRGGEVIQAVHDSSEIDQTDHGQDNLDLDVGTSYIDWSELTEQALRRRDYQTLFAVFYNLVIYHYAKLSRQAPPAENFQGAYRQWREGGVYTRSRFKSLIGINAVEGDDTQNIIQRARTGNTYSVNSGYKGASNNTDYDNVIYYRDGNGNIDFGASPATTVTNYNSTETPTIDANDIKWADPVDHASRVQMANDITDPHAGLMPSGKSVKLSSATRSQHFAIADSIYGNNRTGTWTWHHLSPKYWMVLVDMRVHAKHGHNGGVYLW